MTGQGRTVQRRVLVIHDNPAIHADARKVLAPQPAASRDLAADEAILFGAADRAGAAAIADLEFQVNDVTVTRKRVA
jgi:hypothetical protein